MDSIEKAIQKAKIKHINGIDISEEIEDMLVGTVEYLLSDEAPLNVKNAFMEGLTDPPSVGYVDFDYTFFNKEGDRLKREYKEKGRDVVICELLKQLRECDTPDSFVVYMNYVPKMVLCGPRDEAFFEFLNHFSWDEVWCRPVFKDKKRDFPLADAEYFAFWEKTKKNLLIE